MSHLGWVCAYYEDTFAAIEYSGETVLYWCKREVRWAMDYLMRMHRFEGPERPADWNDATDSLILMVRPSRRARSFFYRGVLQAPGVGCSDEYPGLCASSRLRGRPLLPSAGTAGTTAAAACGQSPGGAGAVAGADRNERPPRRCGGWLRAGGWRSIPLTPHPWHGAGSSTFVKLGPSGAYSCLHRLQVGSPVGPYACRPDMPASIQHPSEAGRPLHISVSSCVTCMRGCGVPRC